MKRTMRFAGTTAAIGATALVLSGCSGQADGGGDSITWWATQEASSISATEDVYQPAIDAFEEETGISVEMEVVPWTDLYNKILTAVSSGTGPDVLSIGTTWVASLHDTGALAEVDGENLEWMGGSDRFVPAVWDAAQVPGETHTAVPLHSTLYSLYYNVPIFEEAGATPPATWDEFVSLAEELTVDTDGDGSTDQYGFTFPTGAATGNAHLSFIFGAQNGGSFVDDAGEVTIDSPEMTEAVEAVVGLMSDQEVMPPNDAEFDQNADSVDQLINGRAAMAFQQNPIEQFDNRGFTDWGIADMPVMEGGEPVMSMVAGTDITVLEDSPNKEQAFDFIEFLTSPEWNATTSAGFSKLPVVTDGYEEAVYQEVDPELLEVRRNIQENHSEPFPMVPNIGEIEAGIGNAVREMFQAAALGEDPDVAGRLQEAAAQLR
ncbi:ABC transporter substrate-binding protein [Microbacterium excoecariae]|uniref:ABC transporter substrate-binding protein n=1 Tax=Microbacterium excoecariae TaxID=2715210 RepID=UPI00140AF1DD|nr:sugar ABC transporter substrate-binding protein [Microbacterium excoecariae]NHI16313.1 sugar ABC transporter substrate-binding protein [Microbacterium excoecariae]